MVYPIKMISASIIAFLTLMSCLAFAQVNPESDEKSSGEAAPTANAPKAITLPVTAQQPDFEKGSVYFVGTATVIIRYAGLTILTDPNFLHKGDHVHLGYGLRSKRLTDPAINIENLPPIDLIVLSHMHEDHFDKLVQQKLEKTIPIVTTEHGAKKLTALGFKAAHALHTWETLTVNKGQARLRITSMPGKHGPPIANKALPPVMGSMLDFQGTDDKLLYRLYISGDTLVYDDINEIPKRFTGIDLALLHLGGTKAMGVMVTMDAKQGVQMLQIIAPHTAIPIHYNDYDVFKSPLEDFVKAVNAAGLQNKVKYLKHGETYDFSVRSGKDK